MFLDENNFYSVEEGSSGVLYLTDNLGNVDRFQPNCDLEKTQEYLYEFHELLTEQNNKVKNSFIIDNRDWYPSSVSTLYWQFFFQYVKYETLIEKWKSGQIHFRDIGPGRFNNLLCCLGYKNGNSQSPIKNIFRILVNKVIFIRNRLVVSGGDKKILFLRASLDDFRTNEILENLQSKFFVSQLIPISAVRLDQFLFDSSLFISPVSSIGSFVFSDIELNDTSHWIFKYALEHVKKNILQHIARYSTFKTFLTNKSFDLFVGLDDCNYPYPYLYAVQDNDMLCIGIQHGGYAMRHEGYVMKNLATHPWYDYLIVWGEYWKKIFIKNNKIFPASNVLVASNKHAYQYDILPKPDSSKSILIPYEFLADTILIGKFMQAFYAEGFKIYFKHRSDEVASDQVKSYELGSIANNLILVGEITPEIMASIDIVAGTMTTLLYDLLPYNKPIWILETPFRLQYDMVDNGLARLFCWDDIENIGEIYGDDFQQKWGGNIEYHSGSLPIVDAVISIKENTE